MKKINICLLIIILYIFIFTVSGCKTKNIPNSKVDAAKIENKQKISGIITDNLTNDPLLNAKLILFDNKQNILKEMFTDKDGKYVFDSIPTNKKYTLKLSKDGYEPKETDLILGDVTYLNNVLERKTTMVDYILNSNPKSYNPLYIDDLNKEVTKIKYVSSKINTVSKKTEQLVYPESISGNIAFYCENKMREEQSYEVKAMLSPLFNNDDIKGELLKDINLSRKENNENQLTLDDIRSQKVNLGYYLKITLSDPDNKFKIDTIATNKNSTTKKIFNDSNNQYSQETFEWKWDVTPKANSKGIATLELIITPLDKNRNPLNEKSKSRKIKIILKQNFIDSVLEEMTRNPKWAVASIIAPILTFFAGRFTKKEKEKIT